MSQIKVTYTRTWDNKPLVVLDGGPFNGAERTPAQLRELAVYLEDIADRADRRPCTGKHWAPAVDSYELLGAKS